MTDAYIESNGSSQIKISNEVIGSIATLAASKVEGVVGMIGTIKGGVAEKLGMRTMAKGAKVICDTKECEVELSINVEYGTDIVEVCKKIQEEAKNSIELMTGLKATKIDVVVAGIQIPKLPRKDVETR